MSDKWNNANQYELYVGRWSRMVAAEFLKWINQPQYLTWLDVGCGSGALTDAILKTQNPGKVIGIDPSEDHIHFVREIINDARGEFHTGNAANLPVENGSSDVIVSGLVLNFVDDFNAALNEFKRASKPGACISAYVWDYAGKMEMMRYFWDAAVSLFEDANDFDEGVRFKICNKDSLTDIFSSAGFSDVEAANIDIPTVFKDFDDFWNPFLSGIGPAPGYCMSLPDDKRMMLKGRIYNSLPIEKDGSIKLIARAIAVKAKKWTGI